MEEKILAGWKMFVFGTNEGAGGLPIGEFKKVKISEGVIRYEWWATQQEVDAAEEKAAAYTKRVEQAAAALGLTRYDSEYRFRSRSPQPTTDVVDDKVLLHEWSPALTLEELVEEYRFFNNYREKHGLPYRPAVAVADIERFRASKT